MTTAKIVTTRAELRATLGRAEVTIGLVPTMGALHQGHLALIRRAAAENERAVVSIFVNPTQFDDPADLARYPRDLARDAALAAGAGAVVIFAPKAEEIYPAGFATVVDVGKIGDRWEGVARPGHFRGVATVVTVLLNLVRPSRSYFGAKDFQQLRVIQRLHADLALPGVIVGCATVRDDDGLALSSRNKRLTTEERRQALALPRSLVQMRQIVDEGERDAIVVLAAGQEELMTEPAVAIEYLAVVDGETLEPLLTVAPGARALAAIRVGEVRLIDNVALAS